MVKFTCQFLNDDMAPNDRPLLSARDTQLRAVLETVLDAIAIADDEGRYLDLNPAACKLFGQDTDELLGRSIRDFTEPGVDFTQLWQQWRQPETARGEFSLVRADGEIRTVEYAVTANFLPHRHLLVMRDITDCKRSQAQVQELTRQLAQAQLPLAGVEPVNPATPADYHHLEQIARHIPGVIYQFRLRPDGTSHFPYASEKLREIHAVSPQQVQEDASLVFTAIHRDDIDRVHQSILDSATHLTPWYCEYRTCLPDGRVLWLLGNSTPQREADGSIIWYGYIRDITDSKSAEADTQRLLAILETTSDLIATADVTGKAIYLNQAWRKFLNHDEEAIASVEISNAHPEWAKEILFHQALPEAASCGTWRGETALLNPTRGEIPVSLVILAHKSKEGTLEHFSAIMRDITETKATERALRTSQEKFRSIIENLNDLVYVINPDSTFSYLGPNFQEVTGYDIAELLGQPFEPSVYPADLPICVNALHRCLQGEKLRGIEYRFLHGDGNYYWYSANLSALTNNQGQVVSCLGIARYIHHRKQADISRQELTRQLEEAQRVAQIGNWSFDLTTQKITWSAELFRIFGMNPEQGEPKFEDHIKQYYGEDGELFLSYVQAASEQGIPQNFDLRISRLDGAIRYINGRIEIDRQNGNIVRLFGTAMDITDRKLAETQLKEISERLSFSLQSGGIGCWEWDIIDNTLVWDDRMYELYGVTKNSDSRLAYEIWATGLHPDDREAIETLINQTVLGQAEYNTEFRVVHPDGSIHFIKAFGLVRYNHKGNPQKMIGVNLDISGAKKAEIQLQQSQKRYETLAEASPIGVFLTDAKGDCLYVNQTWSQTTGLTQQEALGPDWARTLHPQDRDRVFQEWYDSALIKQKFQSEYRFLRPDGSVAWVICQALPLIDSRGEIEGYVGTVTDISDRKRQEQALRLIVEGTAAKTGQEFFKTCVQYLAQVLEVRYALIAEFIDSEKSIATTLAFWAGDDFGDNFTYNLNGTPCKTINSMAEVCRYPNALQCLFPQDEDLVALQAESYAGLPITDSAGNYLGVLAVFDTKPMLNNLEMQSAILKIFATRAGAEMDRIQVEAVRQSEIQLRVQSEELEKTLKKLQNTQTQLIQAEKMSSLGQLVAGIAHEINNPVNFIYGNIQPATDYSSDLIELVRLYQEHYPSPPQAISDWIEEIDLEYLIGDFSKLLESMKTGATRISDIVKSLRTFSRLDEADIKPIELRENIESTLVILQNRLNGRQGKPKISLTKNYGKLLKIECYGGLLNQVFMNLLVNAIDAIEQRQDSLEPMAQLDYVGQIAIATSISSENMALISIQDNGCGMTPEVQEKIFNPFFTTKPVGKGTGMGLATSYQIVTENHGGNLRCISIPGEGTEFVISLPIGKLKMR
ncbi:MAG: PAS domain S-box protein [Microcoleus anatoxicus]|uniref:PAS domain S-box protein n=1 Tax=Microcoleus anatoxicus TaxID=2705319 RepID=UPI00366F25E1